ncbi:MAG: DegV family protein [Breznakia sp.]
MKNYVIVVDTTSATNFEIANRYGMELIPLSIVINGKEFKDQVEITNEELYTQLENGVVPTTSQPNVGYLQEVMSSWKEKAYEAIFILTCSSDLSGTWSALHLAKKELQMDNAFVIDTRSVGAPILDAAIEAKKMAEQDAEVDEILAMLDLKFKNQFSFLYPKTLTQLKKGGRISPVAANMASLLKIKPLLYLKEDGSCVDKFGISRTEGKVVQLIVDKFKQLQINALTHKLYVSHANNEVGAKQTKKFLQAVFQDIECEILELPSVLTCHGGLGCITVQSTLKR